jgi:hypothetical protein
MNGYEFAVTGIGPVTFGTGVALTARSIVAIAASMRSSLFLDSRRIYDDAKGLATKGTQWEQEHKRHKRRKR